jgi:chromate transporter
MYLGGGCAVWHQASGGRHRDAGGAPHRLQDIENTYDSPLALGGGNYEFRSNLPVQPAFPWIVAGAALIGWLGSRWAPNAVRQVQVFMGGQVHRIETRRGRLVDWRHYAHATPCALFTKPAGLRGGGGCSLLWLLPMAALVAWQGWDSTLAHMGWFFTKAALLTFGGAYAVLPYVYQGAVEHFGWLTGTQMIDGLALGETTPGPLIMVVAFVGFVGGWPGKCWGRMRSSGCGAGRHGGDLVHFLPSFIFILAGGPLVESTHGKLHLTAPLTAITAAVVGVIASLALFFIAHIAIKPEVGGSLLDRVDGMALAMAGAAVVALLRYKVGVIRVIGVCGLMGLAVRWMV